MAGHLTRIEVRITRARLRASDSRSSWGGREKPLCNKASSVFGASCKLCLAY